MSEVVRSRRDPDESFPGLMDRHWSGALVTAFGVTILLMRGVTLGASDPGCSQNSEGGADDLR
jgi:hypothetical protein